MIGNLPKVSTGYVDLRNGKDSHFESEDSNLSESLVKLTKLQEYFSFQT